MQPENSVAGDSALQTNALESALVARHYHAWLASLAIPYLGERPIEFGSGLGNYAEWWLEHASPAIREFVLVERDPSRLNVLKERFNGNPAVHATDLNIFDTSLAGTHTSMVAYNFLEHIDDDAVALEAAHRLCRPGAPVVMFVPAFAFAYGRFDRQVGHYRRYTRASLGRTFAEAGLVPERLTYVNAPGLLAWFLTVRVLGMNPTGGALVSAWDATVVPIARWIEARVSPPFGQSVFGVARVP
jgi:hypothetical protein